MPKQYYLTLFWLLCSSKLIFKLSLQCECVILTCQDLLCHCTVQKHMGIISASVDRHGSLSHLLSICGSFAIAPLAGLAFMSQGPSSGVLHGSKQVHVFKTWMWSIIWAITIFRPFCDSCTDLRVCVSTISNTNINSKWHEYWLQVRLISTLSDTSVDTSINSK